MSLKSFRKDIIDTLNTKFNSKTSKEYEELIFNMCKSMSTDTEELVEIYKECSFEKVGHLLSTSEVGIILDDIRNSVISWDSAPYKTFQENRKKNMSLMTEKAEVQSGGFPCRMKDCPSSKTNETVWYQSQTRSGDEGMTTYVVCTICGDRYIHH